MKKESAIIHVSYDDDGCNSYKCLNCRGIICMRTAIPELNFCPFCGTKVTLKQFLSKKHSKRQKIIDEWNKRFPDKRAYEWRDIRFHRPEFKMPQKIVSVALVCFETREFCWDLNEGNIETECDKEHLVTYNKLFVNNGNRLKDTLYRTLLTDIAYYKQKYEKLLLEDIDRTVFDEQGNRLIKYELKIEIVKDGVYHTLN